MMIEADVNLGYFTGGSIFDFIPIMAHPPIIYSDLSLDLFLDKVIEVSFFCCCLIFISGKNSTNISTNTYLFSSGSEKQFYFEKGD